MLIIFLGDPVPATNVQYNKPTVDNLNKNFNNNFRKKVEIFYI